MAQRERWQQDEGGYSHIQGTKPQTLSYGLNDSPAGLAAWIVEKHSLGRVTFEDATASGGMTFEGEDKLARESQCWFL